jgi:AcrR family transcriptional regulator
MAMARPQRADARRNHERVVAAAHEVFAEAGPEASLNEIARRAGVGPGTLYRHFPTRHALLTAVLRDRIEALCGRADELLAAEQPDTALAEWLCAFLAHARSGRGLGGALMTAGPDELGFDCHQRIRDAAAELLTNAQRAGTARADLEPGDLLQLVVGIALTTTHAADPDEPSRLLSLVLDAIPRPQGSGATSRIQPGSGV